MRATRSVAAAIGAALLAIHLVLSPLLFSVVSLESFEFPKALLLRAAAVLLVALGCAQLLDRSPRQPGGLRALARDPLAWGVMALIASGALATALGLSPLTSLWGSHESWSGLLTLGGYAVLFFATRALASSPARVRTLLWAVTSAVAGSSLYGLLQLAGLDPLPWSDLKLEGSFERVAGTLGNPNFLGGYLAVGIPPCALLSLRAWTLKRRASAGFLALLALLASAVCVATLSRGEWLALGVAGVTSLAGLWLLGERGAARALALGLLAFAVAGGIYTATNRGSQLMQAAQGRAAKLAAAADEPRLELWRVGWRIFAAEPLLGVGPDAFQLAYPRHRSPASWIFPLDQAPAHAHNELIQMAATQGVVGLAAFAVLAVGLVWTGRGALCRAGERSTAVIVVAIAAGLAAFAARSLFGFTVISLGTLVSSYAGMLSGLAGGSGGQATRPHLRPAALGLVLAAAAGLGALAFLANGLAIQGLSTASLLPVGLGLLALLLGVAFAAWRVEVAEEKALEECHREAAGDERTAAPQGRRLHALQLVPWLAAGWLLYRLVYLPFTADALCRMGHQRVVKGWPEAAIPALEEATRRTSHAEYLWIELGVAHHRAAAKLAAHTSAARAHLERAVEVHERAAELVPANPLHPANRGRALADLARTSLDPRRTRQALSSFAEALALDSCNPTLLLDAAQAALVLREFDIAEVHANHCAELYPEHARAHSLLGAVAMARADWSTAERRLVAATQASWRGDFVAEAAAWANLATARLRLGLASEALAAAEESIARWGDYVNGWRVKASAHAALASRFASRAGGAERGRERQAFERQAERHRSLSRRAARAASRLRSSEPAPAERPEQP